MDTGSISVFKQQLSCSYQCFLVIAEPSSQWWRECLISMNSFFSSRVTIYLPVKLPCLTWSDFYWPMLKQTQMYLSLPICFNKGLCDRNILICQLCLIMQVYTMSSSTSSLYPCRHFQSGNISQDVIWTKFFNTFFPLVKCP